MAGHSLRLLLLMALATPIVSAPSAAQDVYPDTGYPYTWEELRMMEEFDYPSRWDDMTLLMPCYWIPVEDFAAAFAAADSVTAIGNEEECVYRAETADGPEPLVRLHVQFVGADAVEGQLISAGASASRSDEMEELETGVGDLYAFDRSDRGWIMVYPEDAEAWWLIDYRPAPAESADSLQAAADELAEADPEALPGQGSEEADPVDPRQRLGRAFLDELVRRYDARLGAP